MGTRAFSVQDARQVSLAASSARRRSPVAVLFGVSFPRDRSDRENTMKRHSLLVPLVLCLSSLAAFAADPLPRTQPEAVGLSPERLARLGQGLNADIERGRLPEMVVAIARKGRLAYYESFGYLDKQAGPPMPKDASLAIASMTQTMVGAGIHQLVAKHR